jgi:hypothetical protein
MKTYKAIILLFVLYGCETLSLTLREEHTFRINITVFIFVINPGYGSCSAYQNVGRKPTNDAAPNSKVDVMRETLAAVT